MNRSSVVVFLLACAVSAGRASASDSVKAFRYDPAKVRTGVAYVYLKSNIDGTRPSHIAQYQPDHEWIESLKWSDGEDEATLVRARMDWKTFSVARFETSDVDANGERRLHTTMDADRKHRRILIDHEGQKMSADIGHYPWHSYDFDYASLVRTLPHLVDPKGEVDVGRADVVWEPEPHFAYLGLVTVRYMGEIERDGTRCIVYSVDGEGLENRGGTIWIDAALGHLVDYEIALPDERSFESGKMKLESIVPMTPDGWERLVRTREGL